ncbi:MAG TPA: flagellar filament capping protein FliD [Kofleriaceae bacterium]
MSVSFTGLSSGIDTASIVSQLVAAERAPTTALQSQQQDINTHKSIVNSLSSSLSAFGDAVAALNTPASVNLRTATASDSHVSVAASSSATATVHDVRVQQLARGQITASNTFASQVAGVAGTGSLQITSGTSAATINYDDTDTLASIASKINSANAGASASVLYDGTSYRLMVASTQTGTAAAPQFTETASTGSGLGLSDPANVKVAAKDAIATIDGVDVHRSTNVMSDAVDGLTFTLNSVTPAADPSTNVAVTLDQTALTSKLNTLVSAYNQVNAALHVQLDYTGTKKGTSTLFGDSTLRQLQGAMGTLMTSAYGSSNLGALGLSVDKTGGLTLDTTKLTTALASNPSAVSDLFVGGGFASATSKLTDAYTRAGDGILSTKLTSMTSQFTTLQGRIDQINTRADALQTQLNAQFTALETTMSNLKSQQSYLSSVLG